MFFMAVIFTGFVIIGSGCKPKAISLFNGENLDGWVVKCIPEDSGKNFWTVIDGYIEANSLGRPEHDYVWLLSDKEYKDFEITFELQVFKDSPGNSGIQIRSRYNEETYWLNGPQIDIHPPGYWRTGMMWDETRGNQRWIFPDIPQDQWVNSSMALNDLQMYFSGDQPSWNTMKVRITNNHVEAWLNEAKITDCDGEGIFNDDLHKKLKVGETGHIAFQIHSGDELKIRFRKIYITLL